MILRSATAILRRCGHNIGGTLSTLFVLLALAPGMSTQAQAQSAANGALLYVSQGCTGCHEATPSLPQLNAANASTSTIFNYVIANNYGGAATGGTDYMGQYKSVAINGVNGGGGSGGTGLSASQRADLAAYLASVVSAPTVAVAYHGTTAAIPLSLTHDGVSTTGGSIALYTSIAYSSQVGGTVATGASVAGTSGMGNTISQYTAAYTHTANNCSNGSFIATASGPGGSSSGRTVNITVTAPAAPNISTSTATSSPTFNSGTAIPITSTGGPISSITVTSGLSNGGSLVTNGTTSFTYTSSSTTYSPTDSFTYRANGPCGATSATKTVNITIAAPTPTTPNVATSANYNSGSASATAISLAGPVANAITGISVTTPPTNGTYTISGTTVNYTPNVGNLTTDTFQYSSTGPAGSSVGTGTVTITINPPGAPTITQPINVSVPYNPGGASATTIPLAGYISGSVSSISITSAPALGTATVNGATSVNYTPATGNLTATSFQFTATAPGGATSGAGTVSISITPPGAPTVQSYADSTPFNTAKAFSLATSITGVYSSITLGTPSAGGNASVSGSTVTYTPLTGFSGTETFTYTAIAPGGANATATVTMTVIALPAVANMSVTVPFDTATAFNLPVTGFTQINITSAPSHGTAPTPAASSTSITYTPTTGYTGADSFNYTATGPGGTSAAVTVTITVSTLIPTAGSTTMAVNVNTATALDLAPFITGSSISGISIVTQGSHGTVSVGGTVATYTPVTNYFGTDTFTYLAYGNGGTSPTPGTVTVTVSGRPDPTQDTTVTGVINSQIDTAKRFSAAQIMNFNYRMEALHRRPQRNLDRPVIRRSDARPTATGNTDSAQKNAPQPEPSVTLAAPNPAQPIVNVSSDPMGKDAPLPDLGSKPSAPSQNNTQVAAPSPTLRMSPSGDAHSMGFSPQANAADRMMGNSVRFGVRDLAGQAQQSGQTNPLTMFATALSASNTGSASDPAAATNKALLTTLTALQSSTLNLTSSTGAADGATERQGFDYWIAGGVRFGTRGQSSTSSEQRFTTDGISMGMDKRLSDSWVVGGGVGIGRDNTTIGTDGSNNKSTGSNIAFYGSYQPTDSTFIDGLLGLGTLRYKSERFVAPVSDYARADRTGNNIFTSLTAGYEFRSPGLHLSPYGRVDYAQNRLNEVTETGAGAFALTYARQTTDNLAYALGLRAETAHETDFGWALPRMRIEFQHDVKGEQQAVISYADTPGTTYTIASTDANRNSILFGFGTDFLWRSGLRFSIDYQVQRSSMQDQSQAILFKLTKEFDGKAPPPMLISTSAFALSAWKIRGDASFTFDDNINRASSASERQIDRTYSAGINRGWIKQLGDNTRLVIGSSLNGEKFHTYTGLDRMSLGSQVEYQYRASGDFGSPIWGIFGNASADAYASTQRDGYRYSAGISYRKPVTDRINIFSALAHNGRNASSAVFDTKDNSFKFNVDYATTETSTLYVNSEYRSGDIISSGTHTLQSIDLAKVFVKDDVFTRHDYYSYRFAGRTALFTLGYNLPFGPKDSIDFSWQRVRSQATKAPSVSTWSKQRYYDSQFAIVYLYSF